jgi:hypothetical protein
VCALHLVGIDAVVASPGVVAGVVASQVEDLGLGVAQLAEDAPVFVVPAVVPLGLPVVVDAEGEVVVPVDLEVEVDDGDVEGGLLGVVEVEGRLGRAGEEENEKDKGPTDPADPTDPPPAPPCEGGEYIDFVGGCSSHFTHPVPRRSTISSKLYFIKICSVDVSIYSPRSQRGAGGESLSRSCSADAHSRRW